MVWTEQSNWNIRSKLIKGTKRIAKIIKWGNRRVSLFQGFLWKRKCEREYGIVERIKLKARRYIKIERVRGYHIA